MKRLVEFSLGDGGKVLVEVEEADEIEGRLSALRVKTM